MKKKPLERWMWVWLESGLRPEWAHKRIDNQDLKDLIATAIRDNIVPKKETKMNKLGLILLTVLFAFGCAKTADPVVVDEDAALEELLVDGPELRVSENWYYCEAGCIVSEGDGFRYFKINKVGCPGQWGDFEGCEYVGAELDQCGASFPWCTTANFCPSLQSDCESWANIANGGASSCPPHDPSCSYNQEDQIRKTITTNGG
jgi:hypothetical protein